MIKAPKSPTGRLAFREEGIHWNAYYALPHTMEGAIWLGSIAMQFITSDQRRKKLFMKLMQDCVGDLLEGLVGERPDWTEPRDAPEHERTKK